MQIIRSGILTGIIIEHVENNLKRSVCEFIDLGVIAREIGQMHYQDAMHILPAILRVKIMPRHEVTRNRVHDIISEMGHTAHMPEWHSRPHPPRIIGIEAAQARPRRSIDHRHNPTPFAAVIGWELRQHEVDFR